MPRARQVSMRALTQLAMAAYRVTCWDRSKPRALTARDAVTRRSEEMHTTYSEHAGCKPREKRADAVVPQNRSSRFRQRVILFVLRMRRLDERLHASLDRVEWVRCGGSKQSCANACQDVRAACRHLVSHEAVAVESFTRDGHHLHTQILQCPRNLLDNSAAWGELHLTGTKHVSSPPATTTLSAAVAGYHVKFWQQQQCVRHLQAENAWCNAVAVQTGAQKSRTSIQQHP